MSIVRVQDSEGIPSPSEGATGPIIEGTVASELPAPPLEASSLGSDLVLSLAGLAAATVGIGAFRGMRSWMVKQNRPYDAVRTWALVAGVLGAALAAALVVLIARMVPEAGGSGG